MSEHESERSEEAWYNGINRSTSQHHAAATVGERWDINPNIRALEKIEGWELKGRLWLCTNAARTLETGGVRKKKNVAV